MFFKNSGLRAPQLALDFATMTFPVASFFSERPGDNLEKGGEGL
jgi:hypothetical protein